MADPFLSAGRRDHRFYSDLPNAAGVHGHGANQIDRENSNLLPFQGIDSYDYMMDLDNYIETQSRVLTSETLALQTIRNSGLIPHSELPGGSGSEAITSGSLANHKRPPELGAFLGSLAVKRVPQSRLLDISFESTSPDLAAQILNAHITNFMEKNFRSKYDATAKATGWLTEQLSELKVKVQNSEDARLAYERQTRSGSWMISGTSPRSA